MTRFDELRAAHPDMALALYALEPRGVVTFEVITPDGQSYSWDALTADDAMDAAFPPERVPEPDPPAEPLPPEPGKPVSIFD